MESIKSYPAKNYGCEVKRYCRMLTLRPDSKLIEEYRRRHEKGSIWPEVIEGIRQVGILEMDMYIRDTVVFMMVETPVDFQWDEAMDKLAGLPRQQEWEDYMSLFQQSEQGVTAAQKWLPMERMFHLYDPD